MENDLKKVVLTGLLTLASLLGGCGMTEKLEQQSNEIDRLSALINEQYGTRAAELAFAERQVGAYRGCKFLFNVCTQDTIDVGEKLMRQGFTGYSSAWWWAAFIGKLTAIAAAMGALLWLPWHLFVLVTRPAQAEIDEARKLIAGLDEKVSDANRTRTQTLQKNSELKRENKQLAAALKALEQAGFSAKARLEAAQRELAEINRLKENFRQF